MSAHLYFANNSINNNTITCDQFGIQYITTTLNGILSLSRWDPRVNAYVVIKQWGQPMFGSSFSNKVKIRQDGEWIKVKNWLFKGDGGLFSDAQSFTADDGVHYRWKTKSTVFMLLHPSYHSNKNPLIVFNSISSPAFLEIRDWSVIGDLDDIILAFLIAESRRRARRNGRRGGGESGGGGDGGSGGDSGRGDGGGGGGIGGDGGGWGGGGGGDSGGWAGGGGGGGGDTGGGGSSSGGGGGGGGGC